MSFVAAFLRGLWGFLVGDDWQTALGVVLALALTAAIAATNVAAWWVMPIASVAVLRWSVLRRARGYAPEGSMPGDAGTHDRGSNVRLI